VQWESPCNEPDANLAQESSSSSPALRGGDACTNSTEDNSAHDNSAQEGANSEKNAASSRGGCYEDSTQAHTYTNTHADDAPGSAAAGRDSMGRSCGGSGVGEVEGGRGEEGSGGEAGRRRRGGGGSDELGPGPDDDDFAQASVALEDLKKFMAKLVLGNDFSGGVNGDSRALTVSLGELI
jgi:hypothetical protein